MAKELTNTDLMLKLGEKLRLLNDKTMTNEDLTHKIRFLVVSLDNSGYADNVAYTLHQEILNAPLEQMVSRLQGVTNIVMKLQKTVSRNFEYWFPDTVEDIYEIICRNNDCHSKASLKEYRLEWHRLFTTRTLYDVDCRLHQLDSTWPLCDAENEGPELLVSMGVKCMMPPARFRSCSPTKQPTNDTKVSSCAPPRFSLPASTSSSYCYTGISTSTWDHTYKRPSVSVPKIQTESPKMLKNVTNKATTPSSATKNPPSIAYKTPQSSSPRITPDTAVLSNNICKVLPPTFFPQHSTIPRKTFKQLPTTNARMTPYTTESPKVLKNGSCKSSSEVSSNLQKDEKKGRRKSNATKFQPLELYKPPTVRRQTTETLLRRRSINNVSDKENVARI